MKFIEKIKKPSLPRISGSDIILTSGTVALTVAILYILGVPGFHFLQNKTRVVATHSNAATLQLAAESYAAQNQGHYPEDPFDLIPFLPGETSPANPFLGSSLIFKGGIGDLTYRSPTGGGDYVIQAYVPDGNGLPSLLVTLAGHRRK
jgi:hypothetical protein